MGDTTVHLRFAVVTSPSFLLDRVTPPTSNMSSKKDMRRSDLVIPYVEPKPDDKADFSSTFSSTMPMAAMFTRNKMIGWLALMMSLLNWLGETPAQRATATQPGYLTFGMSILAVAVTYMPLFLPPTAQRGAPAAAATPS